jgi:glycosyltransferase involved in cell wall biosynthesis
MDISIVIPVYNEVEALPGLYQNLREMLDLLPLSVEIAFADDGSCDGSAALLDAYAASDPNVRVVHLRRNYGQTAALMAAIQHSTGGIIITMDGDGQNDPADIPRLLDKIAEGFDVVSGWRAERADSALTRRLPSVVANWLISRLLRVRLHDFGCTLKTYGRYRSRPSTEGPVAALDRRKRHSPGPLPRSMRQKNLMQPKAYPFASSDTKCRVGMTAIVFSPYRMLIPPEATA